MWHLFPGKLEAVGYDKNGKECCRAELQTAGKPEQIKLSVIQSPKAGKRMELIWYCFKWK